jgi:DNA-binding MarR family transcriptional regulator
MSDKALADNFGVSESTITRALKALEGKGIIARHTKNVKGGKERHITVNLDKIGADATTSKMMVDSSAQPSNCLLTTSKLTDDNKQNDLIKDNIKDKEKDNNSELFLPTAENNSLAASRMVEPQKRRETTEGLTKSELVERFKKEMGF